jgi:hypothetical protein
MEATCYALPPLPAVEPSPREALPPEAAVAWYLAHHEPAPRLRVDKRIAYATFAAACPAAAARMSQAEFSTALWLALRAPTMHAHGRAYWLGWRRRGDDAAHPPAQRAKHSRALELTAE